MAATTHFKVPVFLCHLVLVKVFPLDVYQKLRELTGVEHRGQTFFGNFLNPFVGIPVTSPELTLCSAPHNLENSEAQHKSVFLQVMCQLLHIVVCTSADGNTMGICDMACGCINPLAPELFFLILAHPVYKM